MLREVAVTRQRGRRHLAAARLMLVLLALGFPLPLAGQSQRPTLPPLEFAGFTPGMSLAGIRRQVRAAGGPALICRRSRADTLVVDCRGRLPAHDGMPALEVWLSAMDGRAGILALAGQVDSAGLDHWRRSLSARYGAVRASAQGSQRMMQWVRRGTMIRLTWRAEGARPLLSLSLVDGHILDGWGQARQGEDIAKDTVTR